MNITALIAVGLMLFPSCAGFEDKKPIKDSIRNNEIKIGGQTWMTSNLDVSTFRNGDSIPEVTSAEAWVKAANEGKPAWCYYQNDPANSNSFGRLYNWHAVHDPRGLAPQGWHIPTNEEWIILEETVGISSAGTQLKCDSAANHDQVHSNRNFCVMPGGYRDRNGNFTGKGEFTYFTSNTQPDVPDLKGDQRFDIWGRGLHVDNATMMRCVLDKRFGLYVRCIRN